MICVECREPFPCECDPVAELEIPTERCDGTETAKLWPDGTVTIDGHEVRNPKPSEFSDAIQCETCSEWMDAEDIHSVDGGPICVECVNDVGSQYGPMRRGEHRTVRSAS